MPEDQAGERVERGDDRRVRPAPTLQAQPGLVGQFGIQVHQAGEGARVVSPQGLHESAGRVGKRRVGHGQAGRCRCIEVHELGGIDEQQQRVLRGDRVFWRQL
jgi:hypothetical protein